MYCYSNHSLDIKTLGQFTELEVLNVIQAKLKEQPNVDKSYNKY